MTRTSRLVMLLLLLAGCASSNPRLYTLMLRPGSALTGTRRVVAIRSFGVPRYLERQEIISHDGPDRLVASDGDWWAEPLRVMLRRVMVDDLAQRLPNNDVLADGAIAANPDAEVQIDLQRFERDGPDRVVLIGYAFVERRNQQAKDVVRLRISVRPAGPGIRDQVDAMSLAVGDAADAVAARLAP